MLAQGTLRSASCQHHTVAREHLRRSARLCSDRIACSWTAKAGVTSATRSCRKEASTVRCAASTAVDQAASSTQQVPPAVLPGTPKNFPIPPEKLIEMAKKLEAASGGAEDDSLLAPDFRFEFPVVSLGREEYLKAVRSFNLKKAFPNMATNAYDFRVDKYEPNRVWFTTRFTGTHTGPLTFGGNTFEATGRTVQSAPEAISYVFNEDGLCTSYTGGYQMDRRVGNTQNLGALFGVLAAIGVPVPQPGSVGFTIAQTLNRVRTAVTGVFK